MKVEFLDGSTLVSCDNNGSTKFWDISTGSHKTDVPGKTFTFTLSKAAAGSEQRAGRFLITVEDDLVLVFQADSGEASDANVTAKKVPVAFFRAPSPIQTIACMGEHIGVGCESGAVIHLRAVWLVERS